MAANALRQSTASVFYEQIVQEYQRKELAQLAILDNIVQEKGDKKKDQKSSAAKDKTRSWREHTLEPEELAKQLETKIKKDPRDAKYFGLTDLQGQEKLGRYGKNTLAERKQLPCFVRFLLTMTGLFNYVIIVGSLLCFVVYGIEVDKSDRQNLYLACCLIVVIIITAIFNFQQQAKAGEIMAQFKDKIPQQAPVWRNGEKVLLQADQLVPGDIVEVNTGAQIPADLVLLKCEGMKVDNSSLTGESEELERVVDKFVENIFESPNVAFFGTTCTSGSGTGIIIKTGNQTVIGQIAHMAANADNVETPIARELDHFIKIVAGIAISSGLLFFCINFAYRYPIVQNISFMIGIIVANIPEGLLITVTVCMALAAQRMGDRDVMVKNLQGVETLGSTTCICSDKTGTLTQNKMTASQLFYNGKVVDVSENYEGVKEGKEVAYGEDLEDPGFQAVLQCLSLGTKASFAYTPTTPEMKQYLAKQRGVKASTLEKVVLTQEQEREATLALKEIQENLPLTDKACSGDASETGLIKFYQGIYDLEATRTRYPTFTYELEGGKTEECLIPFSSEIKFNLYIRDMNQEDPREGLTIFMKGAPERILQRCSRILIDEEEVEFDEHWQGEVQRANELFGAMGERVLAFARLSLDPSIYTKDPAYNFDVKNWKMWMNAKERDPQYPGWFPMYNLTLVGVMSLNDPPRVTVPHSVKVCQDAGIKVIMVTGDQPPTAAAIAHKVNIISDPSLEYYTMIKNGYSEEEAWSRCKAVVIHGDELAEKYAAQEYLDDLDPEKGRFLLEWIKKPEVVFARTTPSQKLLIVEACQKLGHIVAVTGDGVNDSPAIKKADIGVAMGSGSEVAKNAADILLLNDDFSAIEEGVKQGRVMFDNLKKSIVYALAVNIAQLFPVMFFILFQIPVPLSSILMLVICVGTDMAPAIALAYEYGELDIMERMPRNAKRDHLVTAKLMCFCYLQIGILELGGGMFTYFSVLNDFGIPFTTTISLNNQPGYFPNPTDVYNPYEPNFGNSNFGIGATQTIAWGTMQDNQMDIRLFYSFNKRTDWSRCRWNPSDPEIAQKWRISPLTDTQICYTPEALFYAQSAYFCACLCVQWANLIICKTRRLSLAQQQFVNTAIFVGLAIETGLAIVTSYIYWIGIGIYTRFIPSLHFCIPAMAYFCIILYYDEVRKYFVRQGMTPKDGKIKFDGWIARNTFY